MNPDRFPNALVHESSPYLLQHAYNPVQWYPWGPVALEEARNTGKPILVSIGYSACHWCHVMERESFEDETVADYMNRHFVNIKIDREERPDLDQIYMDAVQAISGSGGWPLNVFLTPEGKPFYGGTYFPPKRAFNRPSWMEVLQFMTDAWNNRRDELTEQADKLISHIHDANRFYAGLQQQNTVPETEAFLPLHLKTIRDAIMQQADREEGGFGRAPKFPQTTTIQYLLAYAYFNNDQEALAQAELSLTKMLTGGIYDHVGGGLARYSTDSRWLVPHFEKMLYDNALLLMALADAYRLTRNERYKTGMLKTIGFLNREMLHPEGGYYAALDADSEGEEGRFYVWDIEEIRSVCGEDAELAIAYFGVTQGGNWEGVNILTTVSDDAVFAAGHGLTTDELRRRIDIAEKRLLQARSKRTRPGTDDKIILGWNALLLTATCRCFAALGDETLRVKAVELAAFLLRVFSTGGLVNRHTYKNGEARYPSFLDDYAFLIQALIDLQEITADQAYLEEAARLTEHVMEHFSDPETGLFFYTTSGQDDLVARKLDVFDNATPSGNSVMAANLLQLSILLDRPEWAQKAREMISGLSPLVLRHPTSFAVWASQLAILVNGINEIAVLGPGYDSMLTGILAEYIPNRVLQASAGESELPLLKGKSAGNPVLAYVCREYACRPPVSGLDEVKSLIKIATI